MSDEGLREGWLANWLITERVTGLGGSCIQLTQRDMSAHDLIVVKEITHTHTIYVYATYNDNYINNATMQLKNIIMRFQSS